VRYILVLALIVFGLLAASSAQAAQCDAVQTAQVDQAVGHMIVRAQAAYAAVPSSAADPQEAYARYFGSYSDANAEAVRNTLNQIIASASVGSHDYECFEEGEGSCGALSLAFVYSDEPYMIHVCPQFFNEPTSEQENAMAHEYAHFAGIESDATDASTHACSDESSCVDLALADPDRAVTSAYSYGLYTLQF
jgi:peptidyl-Lys metalloendopeptidase